MLRSAHLKKEHIVILNSTYRRRCVSSASVIASLTMIAPPTVSDVFSGAKLARIKFQATQDHVSDLAVVSLVSIHDRRGLLEAKEARHQRVFHKHDDCDHIENRHFALHVEPGVRLTKSDQTFQHANRLTILANFRVLA